MKLISSVEKSAKTSLLVDLGVALAVSITAALLTSLISMLNFTPRHTSFLIHAKLMLLAVFAYSAVALLLHRFWEGLLRRMVPNWILIAVFGSVVFVCADLIPGVISGWYDPLRMEPSLSKYIATEISAARSVVMFLSLVTLPVAGIVHYFDFIAGLVKRRCLSKSGDANMLR